MSTALANTPTEKQCFDCKQVKPLSDFYRRRATRDGSSTYCKVCEGVRVKASRLKYGTSEERRRKDTEAQRRYRRRRKVLIDTFKSAPCVDCGNQYPPCAMDFHHLDPSTKTDKGVGRMRRRALSLTSIKSEIAKCVLLCANCHRIRHHGNA